MHDRVLKGMLLATAAMACWSPAAAQMASPAKQDDAQATASTDDIVVTAQRREQRLQDVPIAISAIRGEDLTANGLQNTENLPAAFPGLQIQRSTGGASPFIRGVGSSNTGIGTSRAVALYVDDVYINAAGANVFNLNNIAGIEVSKGPQGTLFGRNATGGVIQIHTRDPGSHSGIDATAGYASFDTLSGSLYADTRINDAVAINIAASGSDQREGWGRNVPTGQDIYLGGYYTVRGKILIEQGSTRLLVSADYYNSDEDQGYNRQALPGTVTAGGGTYRGKYLATLNIPDTVSNVQWGLSFDLKHDFGPLSLVSVSAIRRSDFNATFDQDGSPLALVQAVLPSRTDSISQEVRLQSNGNSAFTWLLGGFYYNERAAFEPLLIGGASFAAAPFFGSQRQYSRQDLNSYSAFADGTYNLGARTRVTAGLRYTSDNYDEQTQTINATGATIAPLLQQHATFSRLTWRFVLDHRLSDDILTYASYSRGFRSGGYVLTAPRGGVLEPEVIDAYEVGIKSDLFGRKLRLNVAGFYYDYTNLQVSVIQGGLVSSINAAAARLYGVDAELVWHAAPGLTFNTSASYLHATYTSFPAGQLFLPAPATCGPPPAVLPGARTGGNIQCGVDLAGYQIPQAPKLTANVGVTYERDTGIGNLRFTSNYYYNDGFYFGSDEGGLQPSYSLLNASVTWTAPSRKYDVRFWGNNLLNKYYYSYIGHGTLGDQGALAAPRTYGATLGVHF